MSRKTVVSRREFIKGAAAAAAGVTLASAGTSALAQGPVPIPTKWDKEADVVVVGAGTGLAAALAAAASGARVLVLEKAATAGGNAALSGGWVWIPNNSVMKARGIPDSKENALKYMKLVAADQSEDALINAFLDKGPEMVDFVTKYSPISWVVNDQLPCTEYHPEWPGAVPMGRTLLPTQNGPFMQGGLLIKGLLDGLKASKVAEILLETPALRLITRMMADGRQEVLGVAADNKGTVLNIKANKGVILMAGGYDWDWEMKQHFLRGPTPYAVGVPTNTGDGIKMGLAVGADLRNMNETWGFPVYKGDAEINKAKNKPASTWATVDRTKAGAIWVNRYGERFCNEASDYDSVWRSFFAWENWGELRYRNLPAFQICDNKYRTKYGIFGVAADKMLPDWVKKADSLRDLAKAIGVDPDGLEKTVAEFNKNAKDGKDPIFHRGESLYDRVWARTGIDGPAATLAPLDQAPFFAAEVAMGDVGTKGGVRVNANAQVLNPFGQVIQRLYAAGNNTGIGAPGANYGGGGGTIGPAMTFGYIAGRHVVTLDAWKPSA